MNITKICDISSIRIKILLVFTLLPFLYLYSLKLPMEVSMSKILRITFLMLIIALLSIAGCSKKDEGTNEAPVIERISVSPDTVLTSETVDLVCFASDPDAGREPDIDEIVYDSLRYSWTATGGQFIEGTNASTAIWIAPTSTGRFGFEVYVSDGDIGVHDSTWVQVVDQVIIPELACRIIQPGDSLYFSTSETIHFEGRIVGYEEFTEFFTEITWESDVDGVLNTALPDSSGKISFSTELSQANHHITLTVVVDGVYTSNDQVFATVFEVEPIELYPIERGYLTNRFLWIHEADPEQFLGYRVVRSSSQLGTEVIAFIEDPNITTYVDTSLVLGDFYSYQIFADYPFDISSESNVASIEAGVFTAVGSEVKDMHYDDRTQYLYVSLPAYNSVYAIDVTANNVDYDYHFSDDQSMFSPCGFAYNDEFNAIYVASPGDSSIWSIDLDYHYFDHLIDQRSRGIQPLYLDFDELRQTLYVTTNNSFPQKIIDPHGAYELTSIINSNAVVNNSFLIVDNERDHLYIGEIGNYPASLWKYDISVSPPSLLIEDTHNSIGYSLWDMALAPDASRMYLACEVPHYVQIVDPGTFGELGRIETGPSPNVAQLTSDGRYLFTSDAFELQKWDTTTNTLVETWDFDARISRAGVRISEDQEILMVVTGEPGLSKIFIIYVN
jgi:hypothetical protein